MQGWLRRSLNYQDTLKEKDCHYHWRYTQKQISIVSSLFLLRQTSLSCLGEGGGVNEITKYANCTVVVSPPPQVKREPPERNLVRGVKGESPVRAFRLRRRRCYKGGGGGGKGLFLPLRSLPPARVGWGKGGGAFSRSIFGAEGSCEEGGEGEAREAERKWKKVCSSSSSPLSARGGYV